MKKLYHLLDNELTLNGITEIYSCGTTSGMVCYNDGSSIEIFEDVESLSKLKLLLEKYNLEYEILSLESNEIFNENDHDDWNIKIIGYKEL